MTLREKEAFIAGFLASGEGYNGSIVVGASDGPMAAAAKEYEMWVCDHDMTEWEYQRDARHGDREVWERKCPNCPKLEREFRDK